MRMFLSFTFHPRHVVYWPASLDRRRSSLTTPLATCWWAHLLSRSSSGPSSRTRPTLSWCVGVLLPKSSFLTLHYSSDRWDASCAWSDQPHNAPGRANDRDERVWGVGVTFVLLLGVCLALLSPSCATQVVTDSEGTVYQTDRSHCDRSEATRWLHEVVRTGMVSPWHLDIGMVRVLRPVLRCTLGGARPRSEGCGGKAGHPCASPLLTRARSLSLSRSLSLPLSLAPAPACPSSLSPSASTSRPTTSTGPARRRWCGHTLLRSWLLGLY